MIQNPDSKTNDGEKSTINKILSHEERRVLFIRIFQGVNLRQVRTRTRKRRRRRRRTELYGGRNVKEKEEKEEEHNRKIIE